MKDLILLSQSQSYWKKSISFPSYPSLNDNQQVDIGIVGAGLTGLTSAYLLSKAGLSVCLIDAGSVLSGTTAHTTAKVTTQHGPIYHELISHFGKESAKNYYEANMAGFHFIKDLVNKHQIECDYETSKAHMYASTTEELATLEKEMKAYETLNIPGALTYENELPFKIKGDLSMSGQAGFHPLKFGSYLLQACEDAGVKVKTSL